jgi:hypothetical protein
MRSKRATLRMLGVVVTAVAVWGGVVAYVGPTFGFDMGTTDRAWTWNTGHTLLNLGPGVAGAVGGLLLVLGPWMLLPLGAALGLLAGLWFLVGPSLEPLWQTASGVAALGSSGSTTERGLEGLGYYYGTGATLLLFSAVALGIILSPAAPAAAAEPAKPAEGEVREPDRASFPHPTPA